MPATGFEYVAVTWPQPRQSVQIAAVWKRGQASIPYRVDASHSGQPFESWRQRTGLGSSTLFKNNRAHGGVAGRRGRRCPCRNNVNGSAGCWSGWRRSGKNVSTRPQLQHASQRSPQPSTTDSHLGRPPQLTQHVDMTPPTGPLLSWSCELEGGIGTSRSRRRGLAASRCGRLRPPSVRRPSR